MASAAQQIIILFDFSAVRPIKKTTKESIVKGCCGCCDPVVVPVVWERLAASVGHAVEHDHDEADGGNDEGQVDRRHEGDVAVDDHRLNGG